MADSFTSRKQAREPRRYQFELDGEVFTCLLRTTADAVLDWSEIADMALTTSGDLESAAGLAFMARFFKLMMGAEEYRRFRGHLRQHGTDEQTLSDIMQHVNDRMEAAIHEDTGRPTQQSGPSSPGLTPRDGRIAKIVSMGGGDLQPVEPTAVIPPPGPPAGWPQEMIPVGKLIGDRGRQGRKRRTG